jgi:hypothetical protein
VGSLSRNWSRAQRARLGRFTRMNVRHGLLTPHPALPDDLPDHRTGGAMAIGPVQLIVLSFLQELAQPKEQGILTEEEFQAKQKQILDL